MLMSFLDSFFIVIRKRMVLGYENKRELCVNYWVAEFWSNFQKDHYEILIGKTKVLSLINRISPQIADRIMKKGL
jgi:hypothetical protein